MKGTSMLAAMKSVDELDGDPGGGATPKKHLTRKAQIERVIKKVDAVSTQDRHLPCG